MSVIIKTKNGPVEVPHDADQAHLVMEWAANNVDRDLDGVTFIGLKFKSVFLAHRFKNTRWYDCTFDEDTEWMAAFDKCVMENCKFDNQDKWMNFSGLTIKNPIVHLDDVDTIKEKLQAKRVQALPNKQYVKVTMECSFCHHEFTRILSRQRPTQWMKKVPNINKFVCDKCHAMYDLYHKEEGNRTYGYHGPVNKFTTPMDKKNTAILGLEMEFEGDFYGWKELEDAHQGNAFYGYDSSVRGKNELSWDCGSYSWWKYLSPLKEVCRALAENGAEEGPTAGIHIHISRADRNNKEMANKLNKMCREGVMRTLMEAVSLRTDKTRFEQFACLDSGCTNHHAGISASPHNTCEFRIFASSLDAKLILTQLKFTKELYEMVCENVPEDKIPQGFSKRIKQHIIFCAGVQEEKGFISSKAAKALIKAVEE